MKNPATQATGFVARKVAGKKLIAVGEAVRRVANEYRETARLVDGDAQRYAMIVYLTPLVASERERYVASMQRLSPEIPPGTSVSISIPNPRRDSCTQYCEVLCATPVQAVQIVLALVGAALNDANVNPSEVRVEAIPISEDDSCVPTGDDDETAQP